MTFKVSTIQELLKKSTLDKVDAKALLAHLIYKHLNWPKSALISRDSDALPKALLEEWVALEQQRAEGHPVAYLIGKKELAQLKKGVIVINTARGAVIDEAALIESLESGHLGGAGLDTFEVEPIAPDNKLLKMENVILTSHVAGMTQQAVAMVGTLTAQNIIDTLAKKPLATGNYIAGPKFG